jgi:hypothetical protein
MIRNFIRAPVLKGVSNSFFSRLENVMINRLYSKENKYLTKQERIATLLHSNLLCQISSYRGCGEDASGVATSVIPYCVLTKYQADEIFAEFHNKTYKEEPKDGTTKAKKSEAVLQQEKKLEEERQAGDNTTMYDPSKCLQHYQVILCTKNTSPHVTNLENSPHPFVGKNYNAEYRDTGLVSITVGHARSEINRYFSEASRYPPRAIIVGYAEKIPVDSKAASLLWRSHFRQHPNVSSQLKRGDVRFYRLAVIRSAQFIDLSGKLDIIDSLPDFLNTMPDPLYKHQNTIINRLNTSAGMLDTLLSQEFNLKMADKFAFELDRYGIRVLGRETKNDDWTEYYLDYGHEIKDEGALQDFFFKIQ